MFRCCGLRSALKASAAFATWTRIGGYHVKSGAHASVWMKIVSGHGESRRNLAKLTFVERLNENGVLLFRKFSLVRKSNWHCYILNENVGQFPVLHKKFRK